MSSDGALRGKSPQTSVPVGPACCSVPSEGVRCRVIGGVQLESPTFRVVAEDFGVAAPVQGRFKLLLDFRLGEMLVQNIVEKFDGHGVIGPGLERRLHLLKKCYMSQRRFAKQGFAIGYVGASEHPSLRRNFHISLAGSGESK